MIRKREIGFFVLIRELSPVKHLQFLSLVALIPCGAFLVDQWSLKQPGQVQCFFLPSGNTRVIKQASLQKFQEEMENVIKDPYRVVMKQRKLPMSLFYDRIKPHVSAARPGGHSWLLGAQRCPQRCPRASFVCGWL